MGIIFKGVSYSYTNKKREKDYIIKDINLNINKNNEFLVICGHTGSGKSTLIQHMNALLIPTIGDVEILEEVINNKRRKPIGPIRKKVGLVFQFPEYQLFEETVLKDIMFGPLNFGLTEKEAKNAAYKAIKDLQIEEELLNKSPLKLSGGQMRKVAIAGIIAMNPEILVLDEPTRGLDPKSRKDVMNYIYKLHKERKMSTIVITHDMEIVSKYSTRVIVMKNGKKEFDGKKEELFKKENFLDYNLDYPKSIKVLKLLKEKYNKDIDIYKYEFNDVIKEIKEKLYNE